MSWADGKYTKFCEKGGTGTCRRSLRSLDGDQRNEMSDLVRSCKKCRHMKIWMWQCKHPQGTQKDTQRTIAISECIFFIFCSRTNIRFTTLCFSQFVSELLSLLTTRLCRGSCVLNSKLFVKKNASLPDFLQALIATFSFAVLEHHTPKAQFALCIFAHSGLRCTDVQIDFYRVWAGCPKQCFSDMFIFRLLAWRRVGINSKFT